MNLFRASAVLDVARNSFISGSAVLGSARNEAIPGSAVLDVCPESPYFCHFTAHATISVNSGLFFENKTHPHLLSPAPRPRMQGHTTVLYAWLCTPRTPTLITLALIFCPRPWKHIHLLCPSCRPAQHAVHVATLSPSCRPAQRAESYLSPSCRPAQRAVHVATNRQYRPNCMLRRPFLSTTVDAHPPLITLESGCGCVCCWVARDHMAGSCGRNIPRGLLRLLRLRLLLPQPPTPPSNSSSPSLPVP